MKYTIFKLNKKFAPYRWWKNYDANNKNGSDIDIETYLKNNDFTWESLLNTKNEPSKYQTINHDSIDEIELTIDDIANIPDYIKIDFTKADNTTESAYYYVDRVPSIYNATNKLAVKVKYVLDEFSSYMYKFHDHFKSSVNPQMFFVRKHKNRFLKKDEKWYVDFNLQPELNFNNEQHDLVVKEKQVNNFDTMIITVIEHLSKLAPDYKFKYDIYNFEPTVEFKCLQWARKTSDNWSPNFHIFDGYIIDSEEFDPGEYQFDKYILADGTFDNLGMYDYIITKPCGYYNTKPANVRYKVTANENFFIWPIARRSAANIYIEADRLQWGVLNSINNLEEYNTFAFKDDNIIGRYTAPISPLILLLANVVKIQETDSGLGLFFSYSALAHNEPYFKRFFRDMGLGVVNYFAKFGDNKGYYSQCLLSSGINTSIKITQNSFITKIQNLLNDINKGIVSKDKEHNPHLYAPNNFKLVYPASSNNQTTLTGDYIDLSKYEDLSLYYSTIVVPEWTSRLLIDNWNNNKQLSQTANEIAVSEVRYSPISCPAYNNTYLQRQLLDVGRNNLMRSAQPNALTTAIFSITSIIGGIIATLTGNPFLGILGIGAGIGGTVAGVKKGDANLQNGLAQNEAQKKALLNQSDTLNNPTSISGLMSYNTWAEDGLILYTLGLNEMDANKINNDDNMYGYYTNAWLSYADYLECWDGNYMLCDISKNYNALYNELKKIDSIYTNNDTYINKFLNALNNGITWFDNGNYVNLATDENNWERVFPRATNKK